MQSDRPDRPPIAIRRAEERDYAKVRALYALLQNAHASNQPQVFAPAGESELTRLDFRLTLESNDVLVLLAEREGEVLAAAQASLAYPPGNAELRARRSVHVTHLITEPHARRQGHGRALIGAIAAWARANEADTIQLWVWEGNAEAAAFYRALGYRTTATLLTLALPGEAPSTEAARTGPPPSPISDR
jgi:diamine N-acetyltransferase